MLIFFFLFLSAWVGSMAIGLTFLLGPLAIYVCSHCGCRIATCTGSLIVIISVFLASIINDMKWMYLAFSVLNGLGSSLLYFSSLVVLIEYFHKHLSLANGIVLSGSGIGTFCINLISQKIISNYGLSMTYKAIAGLYIICFFAGLTFAPTHDYSKDIVLDEKKGDLQGHESLTTRFKRCFKVGEPWRNKGFIAWIGAIAVVMFAYYIPSMYIVSYWSKWLMLIYDHKPLIMGRINHMELELTAYSIDLYKRLSPVPEMMLKGGVGRSLCMHPFQE